MSSKGWFWTLLVLFSLAGACVYSPAFADGTPRRTAIYDRSGKVTSQTAEVTFTPADVGAGKRAGVGLNTSNYLTGTTGAFTAVNVTVGSTLLVDITGFACAQITPLSSAILVPMGTKDEFEGFVTKYKTANAKVQVTLCGEDGSCNNGGAPANSLPCPGATDNIPIPVPASRVVGQTVLTCPGQSLANKCTFYCSNYAGFVAGAPNTCVLYVCTGGAPGNAQVCPSTTYFTGGNRARAVWYNDSSGCPADLELAACKYYCLETFHLAAGACAVNTCGAIPTANGSMCNNKQPVVHGTIPSYEDKPCNNSSDSCKFDCDNGFGWDGSACVPNVCRAPQPTNSTKCNAKVPTGQGAQVDWTYEAAPCDASSVACAYKCNPNYHIPSCAGQLDGTVCNSDGDQCTNDICVGGFCTHPKKVNGTPCDDGLAGTCGEYCNAAGNCVNGVACCTGQPDGTFCADDGNDCTYDRCTAGVCTHPNKTDYITCNDGNATTCGEYCIAGVCGNGGICDCKNKADGTLCADDGNQCTDDKCMSDLCTHPNKTNGTACNDGNNCTTTDTCTNGVCAGLPYTCTSADQCQNPGTCNGNGTCSYTNKADGTACDDGDLDCGDTCTGGVCGGGVACCTNECATPNDCPGCKSGPPAVDGDGYCGDGLNCCFNSPVKACWDKNSDGCLECDLTYSTCQALANGVPCS